MGSGSARSKRGYSSLPEKCGKFNVATHPISDAATLVRPARVRNLAHDHALVLVNGKRRHRSSDIAWLAGVTDGAQGPDIAPIPAIALRQREVLRDGATAQYGSDAIVNRLALSETFTLTEDERGLLLSEGIASAGTLAFFRFFINDFSSRNQGIGQFRPFGRGRPKTPKEGRSKPLKQP